MPSAPCALPLQASAESLKQGDPPRSVGCTGTAGPAERLQVVSGISQVRKIHRAALDVPVQPVLRNGFKMYRFTDRCLFPHKNRNRNRNRSAEGRRFSQIDRERKILPQGRRGAEGEGRVGVSGSAEGRGRESGGRSQGAGVRGRGAGSRSQGAGVRGQESGSGAWEGRPQAGDFRFQILSFNFQVPLHALCSLPHALCVLQPEARSLWIFNIQHSMFDIQYSAGPHAPCLFRLRFFPSAGAFFSSICGNLRTSADRFGFRFRLKPAVCALLPAL